ncbi:elongation factor P [Patescibacteria group bacterium]|nr:elongation factor P [Patescibacteria group bacterium]
MNVTDLKTGTVYKEGNDPVVVVKYEHTKTARGGATVKVKVRNLITGQVLTKGYSHTARVEDADISRKKMQYLYKDNDFIFMDPNSFSQVSIPLDIIGDSEKFMSEGENVMIMYFEDKPVSIELPNTIVFEIKYTEPGFKGNTVTSTFKDATLSNGTNVKVPMFIKIGDKVKIDTRTGTYVSKA